MGLLTVQSLASEAVLCSRDPSACLRPDAAVREKCSVWQVVAGY